MAASLKLQCIIGKFPEYASERKDRLTSRRLRLSPRPREPEPWRRASSYGIEVVNRLPMVFILGAYSTTVPTIASTAATTITAVATSLELPKGG